VPVRLLLIMTIFLSPWSPSLLKAELYNAGQNFLGRISLDWLEKSTSGK